MGDYGFEGAGDFGGSDFDNELEEAKKQIAIKEAIQSELNKDREKKDTNELEQLLIKIYAYIDDAARGEYGYYDPIGLKIRNEIAEFAKKYKLEGLK
ncbi:MAG: hypothetical protein HC836_44915 [Richelia sp. RM2_1_2]|nr:hypothetical protein [Richelia sp. RM2_1_2]